MKIEIKPGGLIILTTKDNMFEMTTEEIKEIETAIKIVRHLVEVMKIKILTLEI